MVRIDSNTRTSLFRFPVSIGLALVGYITSVNLLGTLLSNSIQAALLYLTFNLLASGALIWKRRAQLGVRHLWSPKRSWLIPVIMAVVFALLGMDSLIVARLVSCLVGALTIAGVYFYCSRVLDHKRGLLASALLATSPFFLSFAKLFTDVAFEVSARRVMVADVVDANRLVDLLPTLSNVPSE